MLIKISVKLCIINRFFVLFVMKILHRKDMKYFFAVQVFLQKNNAFFYGIYKNELRIWKIAENFLNLRYES